MTVTHESQPHDVARNDLRFYCKRCGNAFASSNEAYNTACHWPLDPLAGSREPQTPPEVGMSQTDNKALPYGDAEAHDGPVTGGGAIESCPVCHGITEHVLGCERMDTPQ